MNGHDSIPDYSAVIFVFIISPILCVLISGEALFNCVSYSEFNGWIIKKNEIEMCQWKWLYTILRYYSSICLERLRNTTKNVRVAGFCAEI
jgi:hypothetical protein